MGFFSDLKEDLSHAVNELIPEENANGEKPITSQEEGTDMNGKELQKTDGQALGQAAGLQTATGNAKAAQEQANGNSASSITAGGKAPENASEDITVITAVTKITGDITSQGGMDMKGCLEGNLKIQGKLDVSGTIHGDVHATEIYADGAKVNGEIVSLGAVKIGRNAVIIGNVSGTSAVIAGAVKGDIDVQGPVILDSTAIVMGDIRSKSVQINNGAVIEGMCSQCYAQVSPSSFFREYEPIENKQTSEVILQDTIQPQEPSKMISENTSDSTTESPSEQ